MNQRSRVGRRNLLRIVKHFGIVVEYPISLGHLAAYIAQERIGDTHLLSPCLISIVKINTHAQYLGINGLKLGQVKLKGQGFLGSSIAESVNIEKHHHGFLTHEVGECYRLRRGRW